MSFKRAQPLVLLALIVCFVALRWFERREPWNSDDIDLFRLAIDASAGRHWVFGAALESPGPPENGDAPFIHPVFRIGLLPFGLAALRLFGVSATAYYVVPLTLSLLGFCAIQWVLLRRFDLWVAVVLGAVHLAWPFELEHASLFLTDLPAAVFSLLSLCLLDAAGSRTGRWRAVCAVLAGLSAWEVYLLRNNGLVLLGPAYLIFLWSRSTRVPALLAIGVALLGVLVQQAFLVSRGFDWGYDWRSFRVGLAAYAPFLPTYDWKTFLIRQFTYQLSTFGRGFTGYFAALLVMGSLVLHLCMLRFERQTLPKALAAFGLFVWLSFSFSIYERVPGGVRAALPVSYRYVQPFTYTSLVAWAWAWCWLRERVARSRFSVLARPLVVAALPGLLITFSMLALAIRAPETYREGQTRRMVHALRERLTEAGAPAMVVGTGLSLRALRLFCCDVEPRLTWRMTSLGELSELVEHTRPAWIVRDVPRELMSARYLSAKQRSAYRAELARIEEALWNNYELAHVDERYALFTPASSSSTLRRVLPAAPPSILADSSALARSLIQGAACRAAHVEPSRTLMPSGRNSTCEYTWSADAHIVTDPKGERAVELALLLRLTAEYDAPLSLRVDIAKQRASGVSRQTVSLQPGTSYVLVRPEPEESALFPIYRLREAGAAEGQSVSVQPAEWYALSSRVAPPP